jgi:hypothetical protein
MQRLGHWPSVAYLVNQRSALPANSQYESRKPGAGSFSWLAAAVAASGFSTSSSVNIQQRGESVANLA